MPSPILARADALMQRRRQQAAEGDDVPVLTDAVDPDDDLPVLLDIELEACPEIEKCELSTVDRDISPEMTTEVPAPPSEAGSAHRLDTGIRDILAHELARRIEQRIVAELPRLIESTVKDYLAEQEMIAALQPHER